MTYNSISIAPANSMTKKLSTIDLSMMFTFGCDCCNDDEIPCRNDTSKSAYGVGVVGCLAPQNDLLSRTQGSPIISVDMGTTPISLKADVTIRSTESRSVSNSSSDDYFEPSTTDSSVRAHGIVASPSFEKLLEEPVQDAVVTSSLSPNKTTGSISFHRYRAEMESEVIVERGILSPKVLEVKARDIIPAKCHNSNMFVVTDTIVDQYLGDQVVSSFERAGFTVFKIVVPAEQEDVSGESSGERFKTLGTLGDVCDKIIDTGLDKFSCIVSLGGGVVNNMCGMAASMIYRGITLVHFPTTMMAQADAAIDFKQAVNHPKGKNLLGTYYPATTIVCDPNVLTTLSPRHILNGLSECIKHGICHDMDLLQLVLNCSNEKELLDPAFLEQVIRKTVTLKAVTLTDYDGSDFNEMAPQYGHAVGHAVEHLSWQKACEEKASMAPILHGEACAIGMCVSAEISHIMGFCDKDTVEEHYRIFETAHLPSVVPMGLALDEILHKMTYDKHFVTKPSMGLVSDIATMQTNEAGGFTFMIEPEVMEEAMKRNIARRFISPAPLVSVMDSEVIVERGILAPAHQPAFEAKDIIPAKCHNSNIFVVTDTFVDRYLGEQVISTLEKAGFAAFKIVAHAESEGVDGGTLIGDVCDEIIGIGLDKFSCIVGLGGSVVNNMCHVVANTIYRGITVVQFPNIINTKTDAVIDCKQAANRPARTRSSWKRTVLPTISSSNRVC